MKEAAICFPCHEAQLVGILHRPERAGRRGVVIVVGGGPQYRVGGHRQLVLWARRLADEGYPVFRFDYRGMGDSHGDFRSFEEIDDDIHAALDCFVAEVPELDEIVLWGECDAAPAILFYAHRDARIRGLVLLNPWVRSEVGEARTILRHYYLARLMQPSFWTKVVGLRFNPIDSLRSAAHLLKRAASQPIAQEAVIDERDKAPLTRGSSLPSRVLSALSLFKGPVMLVLSGRDLVAREFDDLLQGSPVWKAQISAPLTRHDLPEADHTFSSAPWRDQVVAWGRDWLHTW